MQHSNISVTSGSFELDLPLETAGGTCMKSLAVLCLLPGD